MVGLGGRKIVWILGKKIDKFTGGGIGGIKLRMNIDMVTVKGIGNIKSIGVDIIIYRGISRARCTSKGKVLVTYSDWLGKKYDKW